MGNIYFSGLLRNSILYTTTVAFLSGSVCAPALATWQPDPNLMAGVNINLNDIAFIVRLEKLYERAKRHKDKLESGKLMKVMFEIKTEVECYTGKKIDLNSHIDAIEKEAKRQGAKFKRGEVKQIKKDLKKKEKKHGHRAMFLCYCNMYGIDFNQDECDFHFDNMYIAKSAKGHGKEDDKELKVPIRIQIGITASLCGYFLSFIPHPVVQTASKFLIGTGLALCVEGTVTRLEDDEKKEQEQGK